MADAPGRSRRGTDTIECRPAPQRHPDGPDALGAAFCHAYFPGGELGIGKRQRDE